MFSICCRLWRWAAACQPHLRVWSGRSLSPVADAVTISRAEALAAEVAALLSRRTLCMLAALLGKCTSGGERVAQV